MEIQSENIKKTWQEPNIFSIVIENGTPLQPTESSTAGPNPS
jgi:hypothetical protein